MEMKLKVLLVSALIFSSTLAGLSVRHCAADPLAVADRLYYSGQEGNMGLELSVKFNSIDSLASHVNLYTPIGSFHGRVWTLYDVLVDLDTNGNGYVANWRISGPKPLLEEYQKTLQKEGDANAFLDFSSNVLDFRPTAYWEREAAREEREPIKLLLSAERRLFQLGEPILVHVTLQNVSNRSLYLILPQDGSDRGWRYPLGYFELKDEVGRTDSVAHIPRCKVTDPLSPEAFFDLPPRKSKSLFPDGYLLTMNYQMSKPGVYYLTYRYSTIASKEWQWYGLYSDVYWNERDANPFWQSRRTLIEENRKVLNSLEQVSTRSNWIQFEVVDRLVSRQEALRTAETVCRAEKWPWQDAMVLDRDRFWDVMTQKDQLGSNAFVRVDKKTGEVIMKGLTGP